jgi:hypothetical protein
MQCSMNRLMGGITAFLLSVAPVCWAKNAEIMLLPTRVVMEKDDRSSTVLIKNTGDATGTVHIDLIDMKMDERGMIAPYAKGETPQYSAIPYLTMSPHNTILKPNESQNVRLALHKPGNLEPGEYRAHLQVRVISDKADAAAISDEANLVIVIPVIIRNGETTLALSISQPRLSRDKRGDPTVELYLTRQGTRSAMGDVAVTCTRDGKTAQVIKFFPGVAVYRPIERRFLSVPLDETPKDIDLAACQLGISYTLQQKDGGGILAQATVGK